MQPIRTVRFALCLAVCALLAACGNDAANARARSALAQVARNASPKTAAAVAQPALPNGQRRTGGPLPAERLAYPGYTGEDFPGLREAPTLANCDPAHPDNANFAANVINVGPSQAITNLAQVPWESLPAHTLVRVLPKSTPYNERIFIVTSDI